MYCKREIGLVFGSMVIPILLLLLTLIVVMCNFEERSDSLAKYDHSQLSIFEEGLISTNEHHEGLSYISEEKDLIVFTRSSNDFLESALYQSKFENGSWTVPKKIVLGRGTYQAGLTLSPDGKKAFFTNKLAVDSRDSMDIWNIWEIEVDKNFEFLGHSAKPVSSNLNSKAKDCCLTMNSNGNAYFSSDRDGSWDIYEASYKNGNFSNIQKLNYPVNKDKTGEWPSYIDEEGSFLMFSSIRKGGIGGDDIYIASRLEGHWQTPVLLDEPINSNTYEDSAQLVDNGKYLFFSSWRSDTLSQGTSNINILPNPELIEP